MTHADALESQWRSLGVDPGDVVLDPGGTLVTRAGKSAAPALEPASDTAVVLGDVVLGRGGAGIVRLCEQRSLQRPVVVKTLRSDHPDADEVASIKQVTGVPWRDLLDDPELRR